MSDRRIDLGPVPGWLVICAVRYSIGRMSAQPSTTAAWLLEVWDRLDSYTQEIIRHDLEREFSRDDDARARGDQYRPLGWDCDRRKWETVRALWTDRKGIVQ